MRPPAAQRPAWHTQTHRGEVSASQLSVQSALSLKGHWTSSPGHMANAAQMTPAVRKSGYYGQRGTLKLTGAEPGPSLKGHQAKAAQDTRCQQIMAIIAHYNSNSRTPRVRLETEKLRRLCSTTSVAHSTSPGLTPSYTTLGNM